MRVDVATAARNNAHWCDAVCRAHGLTPVFDGDLWSSARRTPPFYPDAVTLAPGVPARAVLDAVDGTAGCSVKDSFADLDLARDGFRVLFDAQWIAFAPPAPASTTWTRVAGDGQAVPDDPRVIAFGDAHGAAGAVACRGDGVVGIANLYANDGDLAGAWRECLAAVAARYPGEAVVGYERGDALVAAQRAGASTVGPLRVWEV